MEGTQTMLDMLDSPVTRFAQEAERRRLARELHDGVVQSLTALIADLEYFRIRRLSLTDENEVSLAVATKLETWQELARESLTSIRHALGGLRRQGDLDFGLEPAMQTLLAEMRASGYCVISECSGLPTWLPFVYTSNLYYIVHEALTNIHKHAQASTIKVLLSARNGRIYVSIGDDGIGMTSQKLVAQSLDGSHQGLIGLRERVTLLGGRFMLESFPGKGTHIECDIPLPLGE